MRIDLAVDREIVSVLLDAAGLDVDEATLDGQPAAVTVAGDTITLALSTSVTVGTHVIQVAFRGRFSESRRGFFATDGMAVTQLQPVQARTFFPCIDRPWAKAPLTLTVVAAEDEDVISNGSVLREERENGKRRVTFATTSPLAPYLFALAIGRFATRSIDCEGVPIRFAARDDNPVADLVLQTAARCLRSYGELLGVPYPWPKLDLVSVPDYEAAGIEATGVIFFRESALEGDEERVRNLVAHEVAHQWFGSLVTPSSWDHIWLSEGFATFLAAQSEGDKEAISALRRAMSSDGFGAMRPSSAAVNAPSDVVVFGEVPYRKGASALRMIEAFVGEAELREGMRRFLTTHANDWASTPDLWRALGPEAEAVGAAIMSRPGAAHLRFDWHDEVVTVEQIGAELRTVPVLARIALDDGTMITRGELVRERTTELRMGQRVKWVFGNAGGTGYYRAEHAQPSTDFSALTADEKSALLADEWDALWSGRSDVLAYLRALGAVGRDATTARDHIDDLREILAAGARRAGFDAWIAAHCRIDHSPREFADELEARLADPETRSAAWSTLKANWDTLRNRNLTLGGHGLISALSGVSDPALRVDIAAFFQHRLTGDAEMALRQTLQRIDGRIAFREHEQREFDCWLLRQSAPSAAASSEMRSAHALLNALSAGFHGALASQVVLAYLGVAAAPWMHPIEDLRAAARGLDQRIVGLFAGRLAITPDVLQLAVRLCEDLQASADLAARALDAGDQRTLAALLVRWATAQDHSMRGVVTVIDLLDSKEAATSWRVQANLAREAVASSWQAVQRIREGASESLPQAAALPGLFRTYAADVSRWLRPA